MPCIACEAVIFGALCSPDVLYAEGGVARLLERPSSAPLWGRQMNCDLPLITRRRLTSVTANSLPLWLYLESHGGVDRRLHIDCPCGCGDLFSLNLLEEQRPYWSLTWHRDGTLSVIPLVWNRWGCGSCFFIETGKVRWVRARRRAAQPFAGFSLEGMPRLPRGEGGGLRY
jgi:hypothetical protein